jgi:uncharacterized coiled-coil DUF342 family protein
MILLEWQEYEKMNKPKDNIETKQMVEDLKTFINFDPDAKFKKVVQNGYEFRFLENPDDLIKNSLTDYEREILELADEMASSMTDLNAHNYKNFVYARDKFRDKIKEMCDKTLESYKRVERMKKAIAEI